MPRLPGHAPRLAHGAPDLADLLAALKLAMLTPRVVRRKDVTVLGLDARQLTLALSAVGIASMTAVSLLQTGVVKHLPDPPLPCFESDRVNLSEDAFPFGIPDGLIGLASFVANLPLAALGPPDRARTMPWLPIVGTVKAAIDGAVSAYYFYKMPTSEKAWCPYCIVSAFMNWAILALALSEARTALATVRASSGR